MLKRIYYLLIFITATVLAFFDVNNRLNIGSADENGFYPTNHGIFGNILKVVLVLIALYYLILFVHSFIKNKIAVGIITALLVVAILVGANILSFNLYFTF